MKVKTSVALSDNLLAAMARCTGLFHNRSDFLEAAAWAYLRQIARDERGVRDLEIINRRADKLNEEAADVLDYQVQL